MIHIGIPQLELWNEAKEVDFKIIDMIIRELSESGNLIIEEIEKEAKELF